MCAVARMKRGLGGLLGILLLGVPAARPQAPLEELRARFQRETDPARKARLFPKLGDAQLDRVRALGSQGKYDEALAALAEYRAEAQATHSALKASGINAEKRPGGFKQLQIHLRKGQRHLADTIAALPVDRREPFQATEKYLAALDNELIEMLFPRQPGRKPEERKPR